jgi:hypothetical protein
MMNDREKTQQQPAENHDHERTEQFNELSELSLEERMNVADQIGIPANNVEDAVATGTAGSDDETADRIEEESTGGDTDL